jgi:hypothetical protein
MIGDGMMQLVEHREALRLIDEYERRGVRILGMEFFAGTKDAFTPVGGTAWESIANRPPAESWREARQLLREGVPDGGSLVEFTLDE